jgi:hypothetical protein
MTKVIGLHGKEVVDPREPDPEVIKAARDLLELAENGEINGFAASLSFHDHSTGDLYEGVLGMAMVGRLVWLQMQILKEFEEGGGS